MSIEKMKLIEAVKKMKEVRRRVVQNYRNQTKPAETAPKKTTTSTP